MIVSVGPLDPVAADDGVAGDALHGAGDELDVVAQQGGVPVAREEHALAADLVVGRGLGEQLRVVAELLAALAVGDLPERREHPGMAGEPVRPDLEEGEQAEAAGGDAGGEAPEQAPLPLGVAPIGLRQDPRRRALVDRRRARRTPRSPGRTGSRSPRCRSPRRGARRDRTSWSHSAEWKAGPAKSSIPASGGIAGRVSWPQAVTRMSNERSSPSVRPDGPSPRAGVELRRGHLGARAAGGGRSRTAATPPPGRRWISARGA